MHAFAGGPQLRILLKASLVSTLRCVYRSILRFIRLSSRGIVNAQIFVHIKI